MSRFHNILEIYVRVSNEVKSQNLDYDLIVSKTIEECKSIYPDFEIDEFVHVVRSIIFFKKTLEGCDVYLHTENNNSENLVDIFGKMLLV